MTERDKATRAKLIEATVSVVREAGYAHASTRAIAEAAGVSEGTIYRHFPDKASLFFAAVLESNAPVVAWVTRLSGTRGRAHGRGQPRRMPRCSSWACETRSCRSSWPWPPIPSSRHSAGRRWRQPAPRCHPALPRPWPPTSPPSSGLDASAPTSTRRRPRASSSGCCSPWARCRPRGRESQPRPSRIRGPDAHPRNRSAAVRLSDRRGERAGTADQALASFPSRPRPIVPCDGGSAVDGRPRGHGICQRHGGGADGETIIRAADPGSQLVEAAAVDGLVAVGARHGRVDVEVAVRGHDDGRLGRRE